MEQTEIQTLAAAVTVPKKPVEKAVEKPIEKNGEKAGGLFNVPMRETAFDRPRDFLGNRFVYAVISSRAGGLALGVNMNPDKYCNFDCSYCEVDRRHPARGAKLDVDVLAMELRKTIAFIQAGHLAQRPWYQSLPSELLRLRQVALSGDGEPTLAPNFVEAVETVVRVRAVGGFFKIVLITNGTGMDQPHVLRGLEYLTKSDEIWIKLDGGTQAFIDKVNRPNVPLEKILSNILSVGRLRPVVIQSLFPAIHGEEPPFEEIQEFAHRLKELKAGGAQISLVQIYSAARPGINAEWGHLPLRVLSQIAQMVRQMTGLRTEVF
jgi:wyosine [tRNA(Phe)-imidazoG37] synthetase (radical SAM superfamily)